MAKRTRMQNGLTKHHRKTKSRGGNNHPENISVVTQTKHRAWHVLFADKHPMEIMEIINSVWLDPDYKFSCSRRKRETRNEM